MTLYECLGVAPDATPDEIKKAHRRLVKEHHPDAGGDRDRFDRVQKAVAVLSDPTKRARYDQTGAAPEVDPANSLETRAMATLSIRLNAIAQNGRYDPRTTDVVVLLREDLAESKRSLETQIADIGARQKRIEQFQRRLTRKKKAEGQDQLSPILGAQHQALAALAAAAGEEMAVIQRANEMVADYTYRTDPQQGVPMGRTTQWQF